MKCSWGVEMKNSYGIRIGKSLGNGDSRDRKGWVVLLKWILGR